MFRICAKGVAFLLILFFYRCKKVSIYSANRFATADYSPQMLPWPVIQKKNISPICEFLVGISQALSVRYSPFVHCPCNWDNASEVPVAVEAYWEGGWERGVAEPF